MACLWFIFWFKQRLNWLTSSFVSLSFLKMERKGWMELQLPTNRDKQEPVRSFFFMRFIKRFSLVTSTTCALSSDREVGIDLE